MLARVLAMAQCLSVSVCTSQSCIETTGRIELVLAWRLPFTYPTVCFKEIWVSSKIGILPSGTAPNSGHRKFRRGK